MGSAIVFFLAAAAFAQTTGPTAAPSPALSWTWPATWSRTRPFKPPTWPPRRSTRRPARKRAAYTIAQLPAGAYELSVAVPGFNPYSQQNVAVAAGQTLRFDIRLVDFQLGTLGDGREFAISRVTPHATPSGPTPRTREGKPDLSGVWYAQRTVDPGKPEPLPWADTLQRERAANNSKDAPGAHCLPRGLTNAGALFPYKLVQTPALLVMLFEDDTPSHRQVFLDGRGHPKDPNPNWMGHSIGHWEGDTLVVDTVGFNDRVVARQHRSSAHGNAAHHRTPAPRGFGPPGNRIHDRGST